MGDDVKKKLLAATEALLRQGKGAGELTVRDLAAFAGVSPGLVSYHFGGKDELLSQATERIWAEFAPRWDAITAGGPAALESIGPLLKELAVVTEATAPVADYKLKREVFEGDFDTTRLLYAVLKGALGDEVSELDLKLAAFFLVVPLQILFLRRDFLLPWLGLRADRPEDRDQVFDFAIDHLLGLRRGLPGGVAEVEH